MHKRTQKRGCIKIQVRLHEVIICNLQYNCLALKKVDSFVSQLFSGRDILLKTVVG